MKFANPLWIFGDVVVLAVLVWEYWRTNRKAKPPQPEREDREP